MYPKNFAVLRRSDSGANLWWVPKCVLCGDSHTHGAGGPDADPRQFLGHRVAHCVPPDHEGAGGYILAEEGAP
jgi:hypothetical protein